MQVSNYQLRLLVNGKPIHEYTHETRVFVEGRKGTEFSIEFRNNSAERVLVIPSVDGLSTLDGQPATPQSKGFVVKGNSTLTIPGWAIDGQAAAKFLFQDKERSYVAATSASGTANAGVIGLLVYKEKGEPKPEVHHHWHGQVTPYIQPWQNPNSTGYNPWGNIGVGICSGQPLWNSTSTTMGGMTNPTEAKVDESLLADAAADAKGVTLNQMSVTAQMRSASVETPEESPFGLGTGWGQKVNFKTNETTFNLGEMGAQMVIYYDTRRNLEKRGIQVIRESRAYLSELPQAFSGVGCKPPPGWKG